VVAAVVLAGAVPVSAITLESPLRESAARGIAIPRAAQAADRLLDLDVTSLARLRAVPFGEAVRIEEFPFAPGATSDLVLERFEVATPDARVIVRGESGETSLPLPVVVHFRGTLDGDPDSRVYVGVPGTFVAVAIVRTAAGIVYLGPNGPAAGPVQHVLRRADSPQNAELAPKEWHCDVEELSLVPPDVPRSDGGGPITMLSAPGAGTLEAAATAALKDAPISIETDQEMLAKFGGNPTTMSAYITTLFAQTSLIYQRDVGVALTINRIQAWVSTDPYASADPRTQLDEVGDWWHANRPKSSYPRASVLFLSGKTVSGGIAWLDVLCSGDFSSGGSHFGGAYAVVQAFGNYPSNLWDLLASAHELGHNFGSPHTHCFSPPIDKCYGSEGGCYSGSTVNPGPLGGTIMSYCHLLAGGYGNIDMRFHERCISEQMLPQINSVSCLTTVPDTPPAVSYFYTIPPCRVIDTRNPTGTYGGPALSANSQRSFTLWGQCGIPSSAKAVSVNVTVTQGTSAGILKLFPAGTGIPTATSINYRVGQTRANNSFSGLGNGGALTVRCEQNAGSVQAIIDVNGYFQ
jgi:Metallo-peptidase family M12